jgi:hypothetical protein
MLETSNRPVTEYVRDVLHSNKRHVTDQLEISFIDVTDMLQNMLQMSYRQVLDEFAGGFSEDSTEGVKLFRRCERHVRYMLQIC